MIYTPVTFRNTAVAPVTAALSKSTLATSTYGVYISLTSYGNLFWACGMFITETPTDYPSADNVRSGTVYNHGAQNGDIPSPSWATCGSACNTARTALNTPELSPAAPAAIPVSNCSTTSLPSLFLPAPGAGNQERH